MKQVKRVLNIFLEYSLYCLLVSVTFSRALVEFFLAAIIVLWLIKKLANHAFKPNYPFYLLIFPFIFIIAGALSLFNTAFLKSSLREFTNIIEYFLIFLIIGEEFVDRKRLKTVLFIGIALAIIITADGLFQYVTGRDFLRLRECGDIEGIPRLTASFSHPNSLGGFIAVLLNTVILGALFYTYDIKQFFKTLLLCVLCVCLVLITALTYSRGAYLALFTGASFFLIVKKTRSFLLLLFVLFAVSFLLPDFLVNRIRDITNVNNITSQMRIDTWKKTLEMISFHPVIGSGLKSFSLTYNQGYAHNCYLQIIAETGVIGLMAYACTIITYIITNFKFYLLQKTKPVSNFFLATAAGIVAYGTHSLIDTNLFSMPLAVIFWFMLGINVAMIKLQSERYKKAERIQ